MLASVLILAQDCRESSMRSPTPSEILSILPQIAGTLGTGLFLGSGKALSGAGPLGALIAYMLVGTVAYS